MADPKAIITEAATRYGIDPDVALRIATIESSLNPTAKNPNSSAGGLFQFIDSTWGKYGNGKSKFDPYANADAGMRFTRDNINYLKKKLGRDPTPGEIYLAHQQGVGGAAMILSNPGKRAVDVLGRQKVILNGGNENTTTDEFAAQWFKKMGDAKVPSQPLVSGGTPPASMSGDNGFRASDQGAVPFSEVVPIQAETDLDRFRSEQAQADEAPGLIEGAGLAIWNEWSVMTPFRALGGFDPDPNFRPDKDMILRYGEGISEEYFGEFSDAVSEQHMQAIRDRLIEQMDVNRKLASMGAAGVGLSLVAAMTDPGAIAATIAIGAATGGLGLVPAAMGRAARIGVFAAQGAAANVAVDVPLIAVDPTRDATSLAWSAGAGLVMGGAFGAFSRNPAFAEEAGIMARNGREIVDEAEERFLAQQGQSSVGAAVSGATGEPLYRTDTESLSDTYKKIVSATDRVYSKLNKVRFDVVGQMLKSSNPMVKVLARHLGEDAVRAAKGSGDTTAIAATERQSRMFRVSTYNWVKGLDEAWAAHRQANGISFWKSGEELQKFKLQVRDYIVERDPSRKAQFPQTVKQAGDVWYAEMQKWWDRAKELGITRSDQGVENYFPRYDDLATSFALMRKHGFGKPDDVNRGLTDLFAGAITDAQPDIDINMARKIAYAILDRKLKKHAGEDMMSGIGRMDVDDLEDILSGYVTKDEIKDIKAWLQRNDNPREAGASDSSRLKHRTLFNENFSMKMLNGDEVSVKDFYIKDPNIAFHLYARQMSGQIAMAEIKVRDAEGKLLIDGIKNRSDWEKLKEQIKGVGQYNDADWQTDSDNMDFLYSAITGTPYKNIRENSDWATFLRMLRDFNFARLMGQVGFSQIPEIARATHQAGIKSMMQGMPAFREIINEFRGGRVSDEFANELEQIGAFGTDWTRTKFFVNLDEFGVPVTQGGNSLVQRTAAKVNPALHKMNRFVAAASFMAPVNAVFQRWASRAFAVKFVRMAIHGDKINAERMRALGLDDDALKSILSNIKKHAEFKNGDRKAGNLTALGIRKWEPKAAAAFEDALYRVSRNMIMENDPGQFAKWMNHPLGKTFMQFRTFAVAAYTKGLLQAANLRDLDATMGFLSGAFLGALTYAGQTHAQLLWDPQREKKLEERLTLEKLALAGFMRTSESSLLPMGIDIGAELATGEPLFDMRSSGLRTTVDNAFGNPTGDLISNTFRGVKGVTTALAGDDYSAPDFKTLASVLPFQRVLGVSNTIAMISGNFPQREERDR